MSKCQGRDGCENEATTVVKYLGGDRPACDDCARVSKLTADFWEDHDRKFIAMVNEYAASHHGRHF